MAITKKRRAGEVQASDFKARCLKIIDDVHRTGREITITKRGVPVAKLVSVKKPAKRIFGYMKDVTEWVDEDGDALTRPGMTDEEVKAWEERFLRQLRGDPRETAVSRHASVGMARNRIKTAQPPGKRRHRTKRGATRRR